MSRQIPQCPYTILKGKKGQNNQKVILGINCVNLVVAAASLTHPPESQQSRQIIWRLVELDDAVIRAMRGI